MLPRVSVVLPCRDAARWLPDTLRSLLQQEGLEFELVVVDDGSTDESVELIHATWHDSRVPMRVLHGNGLGVSAARNLGWKAAAHSLVAFLDADDLARPGRLHRQASLFQRDLHLQQVLCGWCRIDSHGIPVVEVRPWEEGAGFGLVEALRHKAVLPSAWMLRREALEAVGGFDEALAQAEDVDLLLRLARVSAKGMWLQDVLCDYRVHTQGASQRAREQARGLSYVVERHLRQLPLSTEYQRLQAEVRYGTRAWLGWYAWSSGDLDLAHELWTTALGLTPFPPGLTWVHLAENVIRSASRIGVQPHFQPLLQSSLWCQLQWRWWKGRNQPLLLRYHSQSEQLDWRLVYRGQWRAAFLLWADQLRAELKVANIGLSQSGLLAWHPADVRSWCDFQGSLGDLRQLVLAWCEELLKLDPAAMDSRALEQLLGELHVQLAKILAFWTEILWPEDRRPAMQRLEQLAALRPCQSSLNALARAQQSQSEAGAEALRQLARSVPSLEREDIDFVDQNIHLHLPSLPSFWEYPGSQVDQCTGPQCALCINEYIASWDRKVLQNNLVAWTRSPSANFAIDSDSANGIQVLAMGEVWVRPPTQNPWRSTHAYAIADGNGLILHHLSRRYPQGWPHACKHIDQDPEPRPAGVCEFVDATVIALIGLSAETYYHWLLDVLPLLQSVEEAGFNLRDPALVIWHNGGDKSYVYETLSAFAGISKSQCLDAASHPWIRARTLVMMCPSTFASPSHKAQEWLRSRALNNQPETVATSQPIPILWLWRGADGRRPVFGEKETLALLAHYNPIVVDPQHLTVRQQAQMVAAASLIIAPHGGAMANLVFAKSGTKILELHGSGYSPPYFHVLAQAQGLQMFSQAQPSRLPAIYRDLFFESAATEPIVLNPGAVADAVQHILYDRQTAE